MIRREYLRGLGVGAVAVAGMFGYSAFMDGEEDSSDTSPQNRNFDELQDGNWDSNVEFESSVDSLNAYVTEAGSMSQGSLESSIEIDGGFEYTESNVVTITGMKLRWMMGDSAIQDEASVAFDPGIALSGIRDCDPSRHSDFEVRVSVSGIQGADRLVLTVPEDDISISPTC
ncbi:hypothetical protein ACKVMT_14570 [Halobacteriales archaeon Cl-PHB]